MSKSSRAQKLLALADLINTAVQTVVQEWEKEDGLKAASDHPIPSHELFSASRTIIAASGAFSELLLSPENYITEVGLSFLQARALHIAVENRVADTLAIPEDDKGVSAEVIGAKVGIPPLKLERILRTLCAVHIFAEVSEGHFANNTISSRLVGNESLHAWIVHHAGPVYAGSKELPAVLKDPVRGTSTSALHSPFSAVVGRDVTYWDWLEEKIPQPDGTLRANPMLEIATLAMVGQGRIFSVALYYDYPWKSLGNGTVVDVGGGLGGMSLDLSKMYPDLNFIIQDRPPVLERASELWKKEHPEALRTRCTMMPHDFFEENPVKGAAAYLFRTILHDWDNNDCTRILSGVRPVMSADSRILIADQVIATTAGCPELTRAPAPLLPNYGVWTRQAHALDMDMMTVLNGVERTPAQWRSLAKAAGLEIVKFWECRGLFQIVEMRLPPLVD